VAVEADLVGVKHLTHRSVIRPGSSLQACGLRLIEFGKSFRVVKESLARIAHVTNNRNLRGRFHSRRFHDRRRRGNSLALCAGSAFGPRRRGLFALNGSRKLALGNQQVSQEVEGCGRIFVQTSVLIVSAAVQDSVGRKLEGLQFRMELSVDLSAC
jgi:hypothetical protein